MAKTLPSLSLLHCALLASFAAGAQTDPDTLTAEQLKPLVSDKTWAITFGGDLRDPGTTAHWDFKVGGSVCGRLHGSKQGSKCADSAQWKIQGDAICWQFEWIGEAYGYRSMCARVRKVDAQTYQLIEQSGRVPPVPFHPLS